METERTALRNLSAQWGADPQLTQGAGGNTSLKTAASLLIKASGKRLSRARDEEIFVEMDLNRLSRALEIGQEYDFNQNLSGPLRGSIETPLHAVIPFPVVVHVHSVRTLAVAVCVDGKQVAEKLLSGLPWAWVPYAKPGWPLTWALKETLNATPKVWVLQNHGLIVAAATCLEAKDLLEDVEARLERSSPVFSDPSKEFLTIVDHSQRWRLPRDTRSHTLAVNPDARRLVTGGVLYPDQVVFLGRSLPILDSLNQLEAFSDRPFAIVRDHGVAVTTDAVPGVDDMLMCLALLSSRIPHGASVTYLSSTQVDELVDWDAEKHRQTVDGGV